MGLEEPGAAGWAPFVYPGGTRMTSKSSPRALEALLVSVWLVSYTGLALWLYRAPSAWVRRASRARWRRRLCSSSS